MSFALSKIDRERRGIIHLASFAGPTGLGFLWPGCWPSCFPSNWAASSPHPSRAIQGPDFCCCCRQEDRYCWGLCEREFGEGLKTTSKRPWWPSSARQLVWLPLLRAAMCRSCLRAFLAFSHLIYTPTLGGRVTSLVQVTLLLSNGARILMQVCLSVVTKWLLIIISLLLA